jgi:hypothetical protein
MADLAPGTLARGKRSTILVPAWLGSRATLASSFAGSAVAYALIGDRQHELVGFGPQVHVNGPRIVRIGIFHRVHDELVDDDTDGNRAVGIDLDRLGRQCEPRHAVAFGGTPEVVEQGFEILIEQHALQIVRGVEPAMHLRHRRNASHRVGERRLDVLLGRGIGLQMQQRGDDLQTVADAVIDLAQEQFSLGRERGKAVARGMHLRLGLVAGLLQTRLLECTVGGDLQERDEIVLDILDQIVGRSGFQRRDRNAGILRGRDEHHRRSIGNGQNALQRLEPVEARHVLIQCDDVDAALHDPLQALGAALCVQHLEAAEPRQAAFDQTGQRLVVVDIEQRGNFGGHSAAGGTWMTEKNRPSWRMAFAKLS